MKEGVLFWILCVFKNIVINYGKLDEMDKFLVKYNNKKADIISKLIGDSHCILMTVFNPSENCNYSNYSKHIPIT